MGKTDIVLGKTYHPSYAIFMAARMGEYSQVVLSDRLYAMIKFLGDLTSQQNIETGGFLIKTGVGMRNQVGVRMVNLVKGEGREIVLEPQEKLDYGEQYLGTFHAHPVTEVPSIHDVLTFLADPTEQISIVRGVMGTINLMLKKPDTRKISVEQVEPLKEKYETMLAAQGIPKADPRKMFPLIRDFNFMVYQGKTDVLQRAYEGQLPPAPVSLDELAYGIQGTNQFPDATKKKPIVPGMPQTASGIAEGSSVKKTDIVEKEYTWSHLGPEYTFNKTTQKWEKK